MTTIAQPIIETITAEISVVKIGNKQMTISVFNQLYEEEAWDKSYNILYPIWGKTNRDKEYVIFQKGTELRKCVIPEIVQSLDYFEELIYFIITCPDIMKECNLNKSPLSKVEDDLRLLLYCHNDPFSKILNAFGRERIEKTFELIPENIMLRFRENFRKEMGEREQYIKMLRELAVCRQLFIAV